eukprot:gene18628-20508_t
MCAVGPMHNLLLGLVHKEFSLIVNSENEWYTVTAANKERIRSRLKIIEMPNDCGRLPQTILDKTTADGFTAQQWLLFAVVCARICLYNLTAERVYNCMKLLCEIVEMSTKHRLRPANIPELRIKLQEHHVLFGKIYGKWNVSINHHMALHIPDTIGRFGPSHGYWCFGAERLNGVLMSRSSNGRSIEKELFLKFVSQQQMSGKDLFQSLPPNVKSTITDNCSNVSTLLASCHEDNEDAEEISEIERTKAEEFLSNSGQENNDCFDKQRQVEKMESTFEFKKPVLLSPTRKDLRMEYQTYANLQKHFADLFEDDLQHVSPQYTKYGRCIVNCTPFSSAVNRSQRSSYAKAYWAINEVVQASQCQGQNFKKNRRAPRDKAIYAGYNIISVYRLIQRVITKKNGESSLLELHEKVIYLFLPHNWAVDCFKPRSTSPREIPTTSDYF